ncbi:MAG: hypothetical protein WAN11_16125 [Syntrophobacteraceae bacterium]
MDLEILPVTNRSEMKQFIYLPEKIHSNHHTWVPPLYMQEWQYFNERKNPAFSYCDTALLLARRGKEVAGRIMGIINHRYNDLRGEKTARFAYLETWEEERTVHALLAAVEDWAREKGMTRIVGPYGFSDQDPEGFLIEGFEHRATIVTYCNFEWMVRFVESAGYSKDVDYRTYRVLRPPTSSELHRRLALQEKIIERISRNGNVELIEFQSKKTAAKWAKGVFRLMNECFTARGIYGYSPLDEDEMDALLKQYWSLLDPRFLKVVAKGGEVVGFLIGIPDMTEGIQQARGRLLPFGFLKILRARNKARQLDALLAGVKEEYRGLGLIGALLGKIVLSAYEAGMEVCDSHHILETNKNMWMELERLGGQLYKRFRVYQKGL